MEEINLAHAALRSNLFDCVHDFPRSLKLKPPVGIAAVHDGAQPLPSLIATLEKPQNVTWDAALSACVAVAAAFRDAGENVEAKTGIAAQQLPCREREPFVRVA